MDIRSKMGDIVLQPANCQARKLFQQDSMNQQKYKIMKIKLKSKKMDCIEIEKYNLIRKGWIVIRPLRKHWFWDYWTVKLELKR